MTWTPSLLPNFYYLREKIILLNCFPKIFAICSHLIHKNYYLHVYAYKN